MCYSCSFIEYKNSLFHSRWVVMSCMQFYNSVYGVCVFIIKKQLCTQLTLYFHIKSYKQSSTNNEDSKRRLIFFFPFFIPLGDKTADFKKLCYCEFIEKPHKHNLLNCWVWQLFNYLVLKKEITVILKSTISAHVLSVQNLIQIIQWIW